MRISARFLLVLSGVLMLGVGHARDPGGNGRLHQLDRDAIDTPVFLRHHPDVQWRFEAMDALEKGNEEIAFRHFVHAAKYGDKLSQAMVAEMYWKGIGTRADRALGYAWMDLAAERLYDPLLIKREQYWYVLSDAERARALEVGQEVYADYGDDVALPRLKQLIERGKRNVAGTRVGSRVGTRSFGPNASASSMKFRLTCGIDGPFRVCLGFTHSGDGKHIVRLWDRRFWDMDRYLAWKEATLDFDLTGRGDVEVQPIKVVER